MYNIENTVTKSPGAVKQRKKCEQYDNKYTPYQQ